MHPNAACSAALSLARRRCSRACSLRRLYRGSRCWRRSCGTSCKGSSHFWWVESARVTGTGLTRLLTDCYDEGECFFVNLVGEVFGEASWFLIWWTSLCEPSWKYSSKLYSGSKKLHSTCSGNIHPIWRSLSLIGWEQSSPVDEEKNGWRCH